MLTPAELRRTIEMAGSATPAYRALFEQVIATLDPADQEKLRAAYEEARLTRLAG